MDVEDIAQPRKKGPDWEKINRKMANIPTKEGLMSEAAPRHTMTASDLEFARRVVLEIVEDDPQDKLDFQRISKMMMQKHKAVLSKANMLAGYQDLLEKRVLEEPHPFLEEHLMSKAPRSQSGVLVVTVFTSAYPETDGEKQNFSCQWNCYYCPNEPGQPRSYLLNEPGVRRANQLGFDPIRQFTERVKALVAIGHPADKVELLVLGGTWESYPQSYREQFVRDLFYAANTYFKSSDGSNVLRPALSLLEEQLMNETAQCKIIGLTLETRPDTITPEVIVELRRLGCTRVQLGVQHTDDSILKLINREAYREDTVRALRLLKDSCYKIDIHLMPDLPGATPDIDKAMFDEVLNDEDLQADQWKIYPTMTTPFTVIKQWHEEGKYDSYGLDALIDVLLHVKRKVHPWIRLNRVIRDIPVEYVLNGVEVSNLRQLLQVKMEQSGLGTCQCIRCREVKGDKEVLQKLRTAVLVERSYCGSRGEEMFLSYETPDRATIFGFLRLRFPSAEARTPFEELRGCALIRELHVYGNLKAAQLNNKMMHYRGAGAQSVVSSQHVGIGTRLLIRAEQLAAARGMSRLAVISGVGVRDYYRKRGFVLVNPAGGAFQIKQVYDITRDPWLSEVLSQDVAAGKRAIAASHQLHPSSLLRSLGVFRCGRFEFTVARAALVLFLIVFFVFQNNRCDTPAAETVFTAAADDPWANQAPDG